MPHHTACSPYLSLSFFLSTRLPSAPSLAPPARRFVCEREKTTSFLSLNGRTGGGKKGGGGGRGPLLFAISARQHQYQSVQRRILRFLLGSTSSFFSGSSSYNWEGEGDHHLPVYHGPSGRRQAERAQEGEGILEARQERQHPGLQKKSKKKRPQFSL
ncbi:uncharacterized protein LOC144091993 [Stigmatopora argus]